MDTYNQPGQDRGQHRQEEKRMAEAPMIGEIFDRIAKGNQNIQVRYRTRYSTPEKGLPPNIPADDRLTNRSPKGNLCD